MQIYLIRHAIAEERSQARWPDDADRPLSKRGKKRFRKAAQGLTSLEMKADVILSSPFKRAWQTAAALKKAGWPEPMACPELAQGDVSLIRRVLDAYPDSGSLALVGHEGWLSELAADLLDLPRTPWGEIKKGGVVCLERRGVGPWSSTTLLSYLSPKALRSLA